MSKSGYIEEIATILATSLSHKIGAILGKDKLYRRKYYIEFIQRKEFAKEKIVSCNLNPQDKQIIKEKIAYRLRKQLEKKEFIGDEKFNLIDSEINELLNELGLL